jgi:ribosomal protein S18 acetylase RimI-like enzyme
MTSEFIIREGCPEDIDTIVDFTVQEARETEGAEKEVANVTRGVRAGFLDPPLAKYWVAESANGHIVASTSVVTEWSNFHGGFYWWVQSLYVLPNHRGAGLVDSLLAHLGRAARAAGAIDLRLYVLNTNQRALKAYRRCGFGDSPYTIMTKRLDDEC